MSSSRCCGNLMGSQDNTAKLSTYNMHMKPAELPEYQLSHPGSFNFLGGRPVLEVCHVDTLLRFREVANSLNYYLNDT